MQIFCFQNVKVLAIDQLSGDKQDRPTVARAVTLELNVQQSQKVILAQGVGRLSLILRQAGGAEPEPGHRVTVSDLGFGEYVEKNEARERIAQLEARMEEPRKAAEQATEAGREAARRKDQRRSRPTLKNCAGACRRSQSPLQHHLRPLLFAIRTRS